MYFYVYLFRSTLSGLSMYIFCTRFSLLFPSSPSAFRVLRLLRHTIRAFHCSQDQTSEWAAKITSRRLWSKRRPSKTSAKWPAELKTSPAQSPPQRRSTSGRSPKWRTSCPRLSSSNLKQPKSWMVNPSFSLPRYVHQIFRVSPFSKFALRR